MNTRTARFLSRFSAVSGVSLRHLKREWNKTPRTRRHKVRAMLEAKRKEFL